MGGLDFHKVLAGLPFQLKWIWCCAFDDKGSVFFFFSVSLPTLNRRPTSQHLGFTTDRKIMQGLLGFFSHCFLP